MKIKLYQYVLGFLLMGLFIACEDQDEICDQTVTPRLIVKFYNYTTNQAQAVSDITVYNDSVVFYENISQADSLFIPLTVRENTDDIYIKIGNQSVADQIHITFDKQQTYVSKGCGFKVLYHQVEYTQTVTEEIKLINGNNEIIDEETAHLRIYY